MKQITQKLILTFGAVVICGVFLANGQEKTSIAMGGPSIEYTGLFNKNAIGIGGHGKYIFKNDFFIGGEGMAIISGKQVFKNGEVLNSGIGLGGIWLGYQIPVSENTFISVSSLQGFGGLSLEDENNADHTEISDDFFFFCPQLSIDFRSNHIFAFSIYTKYRIMKGIHLPDYFSKNDLDAISIGLRISFRD